MEIKQKYNKLLSRNECVATIHEKTTPSEAKIKEEISKEIRKPQELIVIKKINQKYGKGEVEIKFYVYDNEQVMKKIEKVKEKKQEAAPAK